MPFRILFLHGFLGSFKVDFGGNPVLAVNRARKSLERMRGMRNESGAHFLSIEREFDLFKKQKIKKKKK